MKRRGCLGALAALLLAGPAVAAPAPRRARSGPPRRPPAVDSMIAWIRLTGDAEGRPFAVLDKRGATLWVWDAEGRWRGTTPVLLGAAAGDASVPGIGTRPIRDVQPHERTTPAGRFVVEPGHNTNGEDILWVDYDAAVSMHRVRATNPVERRLQRLATRTAEDNRISYGCINVPKAFYERTLKPLFARHRPALRGLVYVLPETMPAERLFVPPRELGDWLAASARTGGAGAR